MEISTQDVDRLSECSAGDSFEIRSLSDSGRAILQELAGSPSDWHCLSSLKSSLVTDVERLIVGRAVSFSQREIGFPRYKPATKCDCRANYLPDGTMGWFQSDGKPCTCESLPKPVKVVPIASIRITALGLELLQAREGGGRAADFVESDYAEPLFKHHLGLLLGVDRATIARRIQSNELRVMPGTVDTAKKVRIHIDDFPPGLKRPNERKQKLSHHTKSGK